MTEAAEQKMVLEKLYRKYAGVLYDHCLRLLGSSSAAEDALQEVFLNAYRGLSSFTYGESHLPWLYRIATNTCYKALRTQKRKGLALIDSTDTHADPKSSPVDDIHARQLLEQLVGELDERGFEIIVGHYLSGMTQDELAEMLGISRRAVVKRLTALRKRVGRLMKKD
jgi:RNA polymerase sigma-70 factor, ECF subfamily